MSSSNEPGPSWQFKPGDTTAADQTTQSAQAEQGAERKTPPSQPLPAQPQTPRLDTSNSSPEFQNLEPSSVAVPPEGPEGTISWTASEFIAHHKSARWYSLLAGGALVTAGLVWLFTRDIISATVVVIGALTLGLYGRRQPRQLRYALDGQGLTIGNRYFAYEQFRSFAVLPEGAFTSIVFLPLKRFAFLTTIYYDPADESKIMALLQSCLPVEDRERDLLERLMWRIRF